VFIYYDDKFNKNEWLVLIILLVGLVLAWRFRKGFPIKEAMVYFLFSFFTGIVFDHTISIEPFDFYDVNDNSSYQFMDFLTYLMYSPYGYLLIYIYHRFKIKPSLTPFYVLLCSLISVLLELLAVRMGVYHYKNGYKIYYSFPIYLLLLSFAISIYHFLSSGTSDSKK
jgi:hypothetical protein